MIMVGSGELQCCPQVFGNFVISTRSGCTAQLTWTEARSHTLLEPQKPSEHSLFCKTENIGWSGASVGGSPWVSTMLRVSSLPEVGQKVSPKHCSFQPLRLEKPSCPQQGLIHLAWHTDPRSSSRLENGIVYVCQFGSSTGLVRWKGEHGFGEADFFKTDPTNLVRSLSILFSWENGGWGGCA